MIEPKTEADQQLIDLASGRDFPVSPRQLRRWRADGLLPHREVRSRGRASGVEGIDAPTTAEQLLALCAYRARFPRSANAIAISLWYDGWQVPTERARAAVVSRFERLAAAAEVGMDRVPLSPLEKISGRHLEDLALDPAERLSSSQLVRDARSDLVRLALGDDVDTVGEELVTGYFQLDRAAELLPDELDAQTETKKTMEALRVRPAINDLRGCPAEDLTAVRGFLHRMFDGIQLLRTHVSELSALPDLPSALREWLVYFTQAEDVTTWDTRDPNYDPNSLLTGIGSTLVILRVQSPETLKKPQ